MAPLEIAAQVIGIFGMVMNVTSYQQKEQRNIIMFQLFGASFFFVNFLLLGIAANTILVGAIMNLIGVARSLVFANKKKLRADKPIWLAAFIAAYAAAYILTFTVFGKEPTATNLVVEFLPVIGMCGGTVAIYMKKASTTRLLGFTASPPWLVYDVISFSIGGIITEVLSLVSIAVGIIRHDLKKKNAPSDNKTETE